MIDPDITVDQIIELIDTTGEFFNKFDATINAREATGDSKALDILLMERYAYAFTCAKIFGDDVLGGL